MAGGDGPDLDIYIYRDRVVCYGRRLVQLGWVSLMCEMHAR